MTKETGGQAFPNEGFNGWGEPQEGMTLRDYFAAKALQGLMNEQSYGASSWHLDAKAAYEIADAMLAERKK
jgi:hypothetical protein